MPIFLNYTSKFESKTYTYVCEFQSQSEIAMSKNKKRKESTKLTFKIK